MYGFLGLIIIALGASFSVIWTLHYIPLKSTFFKITYSPRLLICKLLAPFDAFITLFLIVGSWTGLSTTITGISMLVYNVLVGIGLSIGVLIAKKFVIPKWEEEYKRQKCLSI